MAETSNIEKMAKLISDDIFKWFKWKTCPLMDTNWKCVIDSHCKKTHPADVVFHYNDPYTGKVVYLNTDLKSYKKGSITKESITKALQSLSLSIECSNISEDWQDKYLANDIDFQNVIGMLFIYNHDGEFDKSLSEIFKSIDFKKLNIPKNVTLIILDPLKIKKLVNIVFDMKSLIADNTLPRQDYTFFYPDLTMARRHGEEWKQPASIEALTAPWLILKHKATEDIEEGYLIYYHKTGDSVDEFLYLIDAMSHYQMLLSDMLIRVRFTNASGNASVNFEKAKSEYLRIWGSDEAREIRLNKVKSRKIENITKEYCPIEIGMTENV